MVLTMDEPCTTDVRGFFINNEVTDVCMTVLQRGIATVSCCVLALY